MMLKNIYKLIILRKQLIFGSVWWNTAKDVHPPLFYFAVHIASILFFGRFSKYIIFSVNIIFFILTLIVLRKIFVQLDKKDLSIPNLILYGASIGAISTVVFQRMYMMLTFFSIWLLYINLKIYYNNFELTKKNKIELGFCIILGFMTQYFFCFYTIFLYFAMMIVMIKRKEGKKAVIIFKYYAIFAVIAVLLFLPCLNHMFFSYRGMSNSNGKFTYFNKLKEFTKNTFKAYSLSNILGIVLSLLILGLLVFRFIKSKENKGLLFILFLPIVLYFIAVVKFSPYKSLRYVMNILPIISIAIVILLDEFIKNKKVSISVLSTIAIVISVYGLFTNPIKYLFKGSVKNLEIAEKYENDRFLLVCYNEFNHIKDAQEFCIYKEFMVVPPDKLEFLEEVKEFEEDDEIVLAIKKWTDIDGEKALQDVMNYSPYNNYKLLYTSDNGFNESIYLLTK